MSRAMKMMGHHGGRDNKPTIPLSVTIPRLFEYMIRHKNPLIVALIGILTGSGLGLLMPQITRYTIDVIIPQGITSKIWIPIVSLLGLTVGLAIATFVQSYGMALAGQRIIYDLRNNLYRHLQDLSLGFFNTRPTGDLMSRVTNDVGQLQQLVTGGMVDIVADFVTFVGVLVFLFVTDWKLTLFLVPTFPMMYYTTRYFASAMRTAYRKVQENIATVNDHLQQTISSVHVVKSFSNEDYESERFAGFNRMNMNANMDAVKAWATFRPMISLLTSLGTAIVLGFGAHRVMGGHLSVGTLVAFIAYVHMVQRPVRRLTRIMNMFQSAAASAERVFEILDSTPEVMEKPDAIPVPDGPQRITFDSVTFSYDNTRTVIEDFSLCINSGESVALVGPSGAGKSTIVNLLMRFYDPDTGSVSMGETDIRDATVKSIRERFGVVSQEILLFNGTIRENVSYGRPDATEDQVREASLLANADEFIQSFADGYETVVGERGIRLSGGQRQRIAIARAILKNPQILVFDEATSHLDTVSEHLIQEAMGRLLVGRTSIIIAHRLSTIRSADKVVVMDKGRIVEFGSPKDLLSAEGMFATMYQMQSSLGLGSALENGVYRR
jgi:ABC-type multidrug transport system fused ATPase/permease subunit